MYTRCVDMEKRTIKIPKASLRDNEEGNALAGEVDKNIKLYTQRSSQSRDRLTLVKTIAVNGCILLVIDVTRPPEPTTMEQDVLTMVYCLPIHLQYKEMVVTLPSCVAFVKDRKIVEIRCSHLMTNLHCETKGIRVTNDMLLPYTTTVEPPPEVELVEPPCISDDHDENLRIYTRASDCTKGQRIIVEVGNKVIEDRVIGSHVSCTTKIGVPMRNGGVHSGSIRLIQNGFQNRPLVSDRARFLILPREVAAEFNASYEKQVHFALGKNQTTGEDSMKTRSSCWSGIFKPLLDDLDYLLSLDSVEVQQKIKSSKDTRDFYIALLDKIIKFFVQENMQKSLSYFHRRISDQLGLHRDNGPIDSVQPLPPSLANHVFVKEQDLHGKGEAMSLTVGSDNTFLCSLVKTDDYSPPYLSYKTNTTHVLSS
eukprot:g2697.t1